jgi:hypothetical protein
MVGESLVQEEARLCYFLKVDLTVKEGVEHWVKYNACSIRLIVRMKDELPTWKLIGGFSAITGVPNTVMNIWQLRDANALLEGMLYFGENNRDYMELSSCCLQQKQELFTSMRYNPICRNKL